MSDEQSTSARLREALDACTDLGKGVAALTIRLDASQRQHAETQATLAASQADLTAMERERDEALEEIRVLQHTEALDLVAATAELASARQELADLRAAHDELVATNDRMAHDHVRLLDRNMLAEAELERLRGKS